MVRAGTHLAAGAMAAALLLAGAGGALASADTGGESAGGESASSSSSGAADSGPAPAARSIARSTALGKRVSKSRMPTHSGVIKIRDMRVIIAPI